jgi:hypothetical protein
MTPAPAVAILGGATQTRSSEAMLGGIPMDMKDQLILTAQTLTLAKQLQIEASLAGSPISDTDAITKAIAQIQAQRVAITGQFGVRHF